MRLVSTALCNTVGFESADIKKSTVLDDSYSSSGIYSHDVLGVTYDYSMIGDSNKAIISGTFGVTNDLVGGVTSKEFVEVAELYLGYISTIPYDTSNEEAARAWVEESIPNAATKMEGDKVVGASAKFGDAQFNLYGTVAPNGTYLSFWMEISKAEQ